MLSPALSELLGHALVAVETPLPTSAAARLRAAAPFNPMVEVRRVAKAPDARPALGMAFTATDEQSRRSLQEFLRNAHM